jgi:uncharacterized protein YdeI (BOF family)
LGYPKNRSENRFGRLARERMCASVRAMKTRTILFLTAVSFGAVLFASASERASAGDAKARVEERTFQQVADVSRGDRVLLRGVVARIVDEDEFVLADDSGRIRVYIGWKNDLPVSRGDVVIVEGRADDDSIFGFRPEIYARALELADGTRVELVR